MKLKKINKAKLLKAAFPYLDNNHIVEIRYLKLIVSKPDCNYTKEDF